MRDEVYPCCKHCESNEHHPWVTDAHLTPCGFENCQQDHSNRSTTGLREIGHPFIPDADGYCRVCGSGLTDHMDDTE